MGPFEFYEQALRNDPVYLGAIKERDAGLENRAIGRAGLLPHLGYSYNKGRNQSKVTYLNERGASQHDDRNYRSEEHTSELQSLMRISYAVFCLKKKKYNTYINDLSHKNTHSTSDRHTTNN